jgi:hypothetical protein
MGVVRAAVLALVAPVLALPATLPATLPTTAAAAASEATTTAHAPVAHESRHTEVRLLAARLYWGAAPPSYPTTRGVWSDLHGTAAYFERVSRGRQSFRVTLTRWVHVRATAETMCSRQHASARIAGRALLRAGYHPRRFDRLMLLTEQCNAAVSAGQQGGRLSWIRYRNPGLATMVHELGHNLGLRHAYGVVCHQGGLRVPLGGRCRSVEYGDSWDAMGHSTASFSVPVLAELGWAGRVATATASSPGSFRLADVEHPGRALQGVRIPVGATTYWVEYQPERSSRVGRSIPGVVVRRQVGDGRVEIVDASPGNPTGLAYPDRDLSNPALPVGSSITTPEGVRLTTLATGRTAVVGVRFAAPAAAPAAPVAQSAVLGPAGGYRVDWLAPDDHGQIVLGYRVTAAPSGATTFVPSPGDYRSSAVLAVAPGAGPQTFTVQAVNQAGWSAPSNAVAGQSPVERQGRSLRPAT